MRETESSLQETCGHPRESQLLSEDVSGNRGQNTASSLLFLPLKCQERVYICIMFVLTNCALEILFSPSDFTAVLESSGAISGLESESVSDSEQLLFTKYLYETCVNEHEISNE